MHVYSNSVIFYIRFPQPLDYLIKRTFKLEEANDHPLKHVTTMVGIVNIHLKLNLNFSLFL